MGKKETLFHTQTLVFDVKVFMYDGHLKNILSYKISCNDKSRCMCNDLLGIQNAFLYVFFPAIVKTHHRPLIQKNVIMGMVRSFKILVR